MIKKQGNKFVVTNKAGTKVLGTHPSKEKAQKQLAAIEISKAKHMHENKSFKSFRSTLNESEYSEVLTGYSNRSAHKDDAGLHHLQSAGALAGINAMLATISKGTYLNPNEAFLKMKVRLNVVQLDFPWKPGSWDGGVGSFDIPVVQFGRVDGYDAQTGQIRFDGKANPTGGYTELNLHVEVGLNADSLYTVSAKLSPAVPVAEEVEVAEAKKGSGLMTDIHNPKGKAVLNKSGKVLKYYGKERSAIKHATTGKAVKEEMDVNEDLQTPDRAKEMRNKYKDAWLQGDTAARKVKSQDAAEKSSQTHIYYKGGKKSKLAPLSQKKKGVNEDYQTDARQKEMERKIAKQDDRADRAYTTKMNSPSEKVAARANKRLNKAERKVNALLARDKKEYFSPRTYGRGGKLVKRGSRAEVKEEIEHIDEAGQAKLERLGKAYDKARIGSRGVLNPENKKRLGDAYFSMRDKVLDKRKKRIEKGTFDKEKEVQARVAHNKKNYSKGVFGNVFGKKTVQEELVGGQKKLDLNKNKRLDAHDFAILRAKKKAVSEAKKPMIKIGLNPTKKIGYEVASIGAGGKKTVEKSVDYTMPHVKRDTNKKGVNEAKMKTWSPRLDRLMANRDAIRSRPKKSILTQKVQDGKKMGAARPIAKYEGK